MEANFHVNEVDRSRLMDLFVALNSSLDLRCVMADAYPRIAELVPAEHAAFCVLNPGSAADYDWIVAELPAEFFESYAGEMAKDDFVRKAVARKPGVALRDSDMIGREELRGNRWYERARDLGLDLEHVMAVMLTLDSERHAGLTLYRGAGDPFSERDQAVLQMLTGALANTVRNCERYHGLSTVHAILHHLTSREGVGLVVLTETNGEIYRNDLATQLLAAWFPPHERHRRALPERLTLHLAHGDGSIAPKMTRKWINGSASDLRVTFTRVPAPSSGVLTVLELQEFPHVLPLPNGWSEVLTPAESKVASRAISGWDTQLIADDLDRSVNTVKSQLQHIFDALGVCSREALILRAARDR